MLSVVPGEGGYIYCGHSSSSAELLTRDDFISYCRKSKYSFRVHIDDLQVIPIVGLCASLRFASFKVYRANKIVDWIKEHDLLWNCFDKSENLPLSERVIPEAHPTYSILERYPKCAWVPLTYLVFSIFDPNLWEPDPRDRVSLLRCAKVCSDFMCNEWEPTSILDHIFLTWVSSRTAVHHK